MSSPYQQSVVHIPAWTQGRRHALFSCSWSHLLLCWGKNITSIQVAKFSMPYIDVPSCARSELIRFAAIYPASWVDLMTRTMNNQRSKVTVPVFVHGGSAGFPPELRCLGTRPHLADNCRLLVNCSAFTSLKNAAAISGSIPGIVISTLYLGCCWHRAARLYSAERMHSSSECKFSSNECSGWCSTGNIDCSATSIISCSRCCKIWMPTEISIPCSAVSTGSDLPAHHRHHFLGDE